MSGLRERELEEERLRVEEENLQIRKKQLELERREYQENLATYNVKERNLETILENEQEIYEVLDCMKKKLKWRQINFSMNINEMYYKLKH